MTRALLIASVAALSVFAQGDKPAPSKDPVMPADTEIKTTASGLKYSVLAPARAGAAAAGKGDRVKVHYSGWLLDGTLFDSSVKSGRPFTFQVGSGVIEGWSEMVALMSEGERVKVTIPPNLGYGPAGSPPVIPANATLVFEIELLDVLASAPKVPPADPAKTKTTASGLKYTVLKEGEGEAPKETDAVELKYCFWNASGTLIEDCATTGQTLRNSCKGMPVKFLQEAPLLMKPGSKVRFEVPPDLLFGDAAKGPNLPPNTTTVWTIDLVRVIKTQPVPEFKASPADKLTKTPSGLQYEVLKEGTGKSPTMGQNVTVNYAGWLTDGKLFDSSYGRGEPTSFMLGRVIAGWNEGLQLMKEGAIYKFTIPANLAYGARGFPPSIPPDSTLVFQIELISVGK